MNFDPSPIDRGSSSELQFNRADDQFDDRSTWGSSLGSVMTDEQIFRDLKELFDPEASEQSLCGCASACGCGSCQCLSGQQDGGPKFAGEQADPFEDVLISSARLDETIQEFAQFSAALDHVLEGSEFGREAANLTRDLLQTEFFDRS